MKQNIFISLFLIIFWGTYSQNKKSVLNLNNPNLELLDSLLYQEAMTQRKLNNRPVIEKDNICGYAAKYQSEYMAHYNSFSHVNDFEFKGILLKQHYERFNYFRKKYNSKKDYKTFHEILVMMDSLDYYNYSGLDTKTYENYAKVLINYYMVSPGHKATLLYVTSSGKMVCNFKSHFNPKTKSIYVTGFYAKIGK